MKIIILISIISVAFGCRSKHKIINDYKENVKESESVKIDSSGLKSSKSIQNESSDLLLQEKKNEISGDILIKGTSDLFNPFVFYNVAGKDTIQSISIMGNAEYIIGNHYAKADHKKSEIIKKESANIIQDAAQKSVSKETVKEINSEVKQKTKEIKVKGFQAGTWIVITIVVVFLLFIFFTYKYFKK